MWRRKRHEIDMAKAESLAMWDQGEPVPIAGAAPSTPEMGFDLWPSAQIGVTASGAASPRPVDPHGARVTWHELSTEERLRRWQSPVDPATT